MVGLWHVGVGTALCAGCWCWFGTAQAAPLAPFLAIGRQPRPTLDALYSTLAAYGWVAGAVLAAGLIAYLGGSGVAWLLARWERAHLATPPDLQAFAAPPAPRWTTLATTATAAAIATMLMGAAVVGAAARPFTPSAWLWQVPLAAVWALALARAAWASLGLVIHIGRHRDAVAAAKRDQRRHRVSPFAIGGASTDDSRPDIACPPGPTRQESEVTRSIL